MAFRIIIVSAATPVPLHRHQAFLFALSLFSVGNVRYLTRPKFHIDGVSIYGDQGLYRNSIGSVMNFCMIVHVWKEMITMIKYLCAATSRIVQVESPNCLSWGFISSVFSLGLCKIDARENYPI